MNPDMRTLQRSRVSARCGMSAEEQSVCALRNICEGAECLRVAECLRRSRLPARCGVSAKEQNARGRGKYSVAPALTAGEAECWACGVFPHEPRIKEGGTAEYSVPVRGWNLRRATLFCL